MAKYPDRTIIRLKIPYWKKFGNDRYVWESDDAYGIWIEAQPDKPVFFPKSQVKAPIRITDKEFDFWCPQWLSDEKELDVFICTDHMPSLF